MIKKIQSIRYIYIIILMLSVVFINITQAQVSNLYVKNFNTENGLPQNSVNYIVPDNYGFIWLGTEVGLVRYDGNEFVVYDKSNSLISESRIRLVQKIPGRDALMIQGKDNKYAFISDGKIKPNNNIPISTLESLIDRNHLYLSSYKDQIWFNDDHQTWNELRLKIDNNINLYIVDSNLLTWIDTNKKNIIKRRLKYNHNRTRYTVIEHTPFAITYGKNVLFEQITTENEISWTLSKPLLSNFESYTLIRNHASNQTFIFVDNLLYLLEFDHLHKIIHPTLICDKINGQEANIISVFYSKNDGIVYMGSSIFGLYVYRIPVFKTYVYNTFKSEKNVIYHIHKLNDSTILSSKGAVVNVLDNKVGYLDSFKLLPVDYSKELNPITLIHDDKIFFTENKLLNYHNLKTGKNRVISSLYNQQVVHAVDSLYFINAEMYNKGVYKVIITDDTFYIVKKTVFNEHVSGIQIIDSNLYVNCNGNLYIVNIYNENVNSYPELSSVDIRVVFKDKVDGGVWIGTYEDGIYYLKDEKLYSFKNASFNILKSVNAILLDKNDFFWISSNVGLYKIYRKDLLEGIIYRKPYFYKYFDKYYGLLTNEFNGSADKTGLYFNDSLFAFSSMSGIVTFNPLIDTINDYRSPIIIDHITVNDESININDKIEFKQGFNRAVFKIVSPNYQGQNNKVAFEYSLNDGKWATVKNNIIDFNELRSGNNTLEIRKIGGFEGKYDQLKIDFYVIPFWYQTLGFKVLSVLMAILLIVGIIQIRSTSLKRRNKILQANILERTKKLNLVNERMSLSEKELKRQLQFQKILNENITHDIKTPLKYLVQSLKKVNESVQRDLGVEKQEIKMIYDSSEHIYNFTEMVANNIKASINKENDQVVDLRVLFNLKYEIFSNAMMAKGIVFQNRIYDTHIIAKKDLLDTAIHNLLDNAIKNTNNSYINVEAFYDDEYFVIKIINGAKMPNYLVRLYNEYFESDSNEDMFQDVKIGLGFKFLKEALPVLSAKILIESDPESTEFNIRFNL